MGNFDGSRSCYQWHNPSESKMTIFLQSNFSEKTQKRQFILKLISSRKPMAMHYEGKNVFLLFLCWRHSIVIINVNSLSIFRFEMKSFIVFLLIVAYAAAIPGNLVQIDTFIFSNKLAQFQARKDELKISQRLIIFLHSLLFFFLKKNIF